MAVFCAVIRSISEERTVEDCYLNTNNVIYLKITQLSVLNITFIRLYITAKYVVCSVRGSTQSTLDSGGGEQRLSFTLSLHLTYTAISYHITFKCPISLCTCEMCMFCVPSSIITVSTILCRFQFYFLVSKTLETIF